MTIIIWLATVSGLVLSCCGVSLRGKNSGVYSATQMGTFGVDGSKCSYDATSQTFNCPNIVAPPDASTPMGSTVLQFNSLSAKDVEKFFTDPYVAFSSGLQNLQLSADSYPNIMNLNPDGNVAQTIGPNFAALKNLYQANMAMFNQLNN